MKAIITLDALEGEQGSLEVIFPPADEPNFSRKEEGQIRPCSAERWCIYTVVMYVQYLQPDFMLRGYQASEMVAGVGLPS